MKITGEDNAMEEEKRKILYISYGGGHANLVRHTYNELSQICCYEQKVIALTVAGKVFDGCGLSLIHI